MLLFRSEEHVERWSVGARVPRGTVFAPEELWSVSKPWFGRRLERDWRRFTPDEAQAVFDDAGLTGPFWKFPRPRPEA